MKCAICLQKILGPSVSLGGTTTGFFSSRTNHFRFAHPACASQQLTALLKKQHARIYPVRPNDPADIISPS